MNAINYNVPVGVTLQVCTCGEPWAVSLPRLRYHVDDSGVSALFLSLDLSAAVCIHRSTYYYTTGIKIDPYI